VPTYDYQCDDCGRTYEVRQRISAAPLTVCQFCGGPIHRLLSAAPFILKGGGWYVTDYPSESRKKAMATEKKSTEPAPSAKAAPSGSASTSESSSGSTSTASPASSGNSSTTS
jgi:putative FmdB family regulatory protein